VSITGLGALAPEVPVICRLHHADGTTVDFTCTHTLSPEHIGWFRAGGALNLIRQRFAAP
jgi:aconitate hydratase